MLQSIMACQPNLLFNTKIKRNVICWSVALANVAKSQKRVFDVIYEDEEQDILIYWKTVKFRRKRYQRLVKHFLKLKKFLKI